MGSIVGGILGVDSGKANEPIQNYKTPKVSSPGLYTTERGGRHTLIRSPLLDQTINSLGSAFNQQFQELGGLRGQFQGLQDQLAPGFGAITQAAVTNLENRRRSAIGNLRENLQRRRVLGSSFAADALGRTEAEFAQQEAAIRAQAKMQEIGATEQLMARQVDLINQQTQANANEFNVQLQQLNFEAKLAASIATGVGAIMAENARAQSEIIASGQNAVASGILGGVGIGLGLGLGG